MSILGRGLSSLIPRRYDEDAEDILEQIDSMEDVETAKPLEIDEETTEEVILEKRLPIVDEDSETPEVEEPTPIEEEPATTPTEPVTSELDQFEELHEMEVIPPPAKPLVTPLQIDPETGTLRDPAEIIATSTTTTLKQVSAAEIVQRTQSSRRVIIRPLEPVAEAPTEEPVVAPEPEVEEPTPVEEEPVEPTLEPTQSEPVAEAEPVKAKRAAPVLKQQRIENEVWDRHEERVETVPVGDIKVNPNQPRRTFNPEELEELKQSIDQHGILQPLVVIRKGDHYELVAGERRLRAIKLLGWDKVPCVVRTDIHTDRNSLELALIENIQRENLNPIEEAMGYKLLNEEYGMSHEEIGQRVGRSRVNITNVIRILQLPAEIQRGLIEGKLTVGHARAILMIPDEEKQLRFYNHMLEEGLTVRKAETRARRIQRQMKLNDPLRKKTRGRPQLALKYDGLLEEKFGHTARVKFEESKNRFEVMFYAFSESEAEELINRLLGEQQAIEYPEDDATE